MRKILFAVFFAVVFCGLTVFAQQRFQVGDQVEVLYENKWYKAKILEVGDGKYYITYEGFASAWDTWVENSKVRGRDGQTNSASRSNIKKSANTNNVNSTGNSRTNGRFQVGDPVEAKDASGWRNAVIVGGYERSGYVNYGTYEVKFDHKSISGGRTHEDYVRERFRSDPNQRFEVGDMVEFRRENDKIYQGEIIGIDGDHYVIRYDWNGTMSRESIRENNVRSSKNAANRNYKRLVWKGQKYNVGDQVAYTESYGLVAGKAKIVAVFADTRQYSISQPYNRSNRTVECYEIVDPNDNSHINFFVGKWNVFVYGAMTTVTRGGYVYRRYSSGTYLPPLEVKADGTYFWVTDKGTIRGRWIPLENGGHGITLLKSWQGRDYTLSENTNSVSADEKTRDEISISDRETNTTRHGAYRIGANKSCVLAGRNFN